MLGLQPRRTLFFDPDYESREATLLVSCRQNDAPGILPASLVLTSLVQLPAPVSNYLRPFTGHQSPSWEKAMAPHSGTLAWKIPWTTPRATEHVEDTQEAVCIYCWSSKEMIVKRWHL